MNLVTKAPSRTTSSATQSLLLLAPSAHSGMFGSPAVTRFGDWNHEQLLSKMQRFRGATYLKDGAISEQSLDSEGRHRLDADFRSWHVLMMNGQGDVCGCSRYSSYRIAEDYESGFARRLLIAATYWRPERLGRLELCDVGHDGHGGRGEITRSRRCLHAWHAWLLAVVVARWHAAECSPSVFAVVDQNFLWRLALLC